MLLYDDIPLLFNIGTFVISMIGTILFSYWWATMRKATIVYIYVMILIFSLGLENFAEFYFRYTHFDLIIEHSKTGCPLCTDLFSPYWMLRGVLVFTITTIFMSHMMARIYSTMFKIRKVKHEIQKYFIPDAPFQVMIVEDDPQIPVILFEFIQNKCKGASVVLKTSADEALQYLKDGNMINMVICDINLKGRLNGFDLVRHVRKICPWIVNIGMTGYPGRYTLNDARQIGFDDYFIKPFRLDDISKSMNYYRVRMARWGSILNRKE